MRPCLSWPAWARNPCQGTVPGSQAIRGQVTSGGAPVKRLDAWSPGRSRTGRWAAQRPARVRMAEHLRCAIARFDPVDGVSDAEQAHSRRVAADRAWKRILAAARHYDADVSVDDWRDLASGGRTASAEPGTPIARPGAACLRVCLGCAR